MRTDTLPFRPAAARATPDAAYAARPALLRFRDDLAAAARSPASRRAWKEPPVFFFDPARQAELDAARGPHPPAARHSLDARIAAELPPLFASVEVRRTARAIPGLREAAAALADRLPAANDLAELLAVPDDEVVTVLFPERGAGMRVLVRGIADAAGFAARLADLAPELHDGSGWQFSLPAALTPAGGLPSGLSGYADWVWPAAPLASVPLVNGERVLLAGPPVLPPGETPARFEALAGEAELLETLDAAAVAARLGRPPAAPALARAA